LTPRRLAQVCLGGPCTPADVLAAVSGDPLLTLAEGLVVLRADASRAPFIRARAEGHALCAPRFLHEARGFARAVSRALPFIDGVAVAGSLASGGFRLTDDVDLNLLVSAGRRHLAYVAVNALGVLHAVRHRGKPVDALSRRPLSPRVMTVNLVLDEEQCHPLARQDEGMAFEILMSLPVQGHSAWRALIAGNPHLARHFPQLLAYAPDAEEPLAPRLPRWCFPRALDTPARGMGHAAWRALMWTRRGDREALQRVEHVRATMRPYTLFDA
jgi:hypothetical protein